MNLFKELILHFLRSYDLIFKSKKTILQICILLLDRNPRSAQLTELVDGLLKRLFKTAMLSEQRLNLLLKLGECILKFCLLSLDSIKLRF